MNLKLNSLNEFWESLQKEKGSFFCSKEPDDEEDATIREKASGPF